MNFIKRLLYHINSRALAKPEIEKFVKGDFIVVDDGLLKSGNPVFEIPNEIYVGPLKGALVE